MSIVLLKCKSPIPLSGSYHGGMNESFKSKRILAQRIKELRKSKDLNQRELAKRAGVSQKTISNLENLEAFREAPKLDIVEKVASALGVELWQLFVPPSTGKLVDNYIHASAEGQQSINRVAELEAKYGRAG